MHWVALRNIYLMFLDNFTLETSSEFHSKYLVISLTIYRLRKICLKSSESCEKLTSHLMKMSGYRLYKFNCSLNFRSRIVKSVLCTLMKLLYIYLPKNLSFTC